MKKAFIISGVLGFFVWPVVMIAAVMLGDQPDVPVRTEVLRQIAFYTALLPPIVWIVALILAIIEAKKQKRPRRLRTYAVAPYAAAGVHALALIALFTLAT
jgi:membrane protein DedA with SNARE-associated domain